MLYVTLCTGFKSMPILLHELRVAMTVCVHVVATAAFSPICTQSSLNAMMVSLVMKRVSFAAIPDFESGRGYAMM